ncbi:MAG: DUF2189 domain-containing protein [Gammaproteobacteria bacterium]|nr:MAG: DUF2189 domain-containing protein [Gammaproteobacteria bacterium]
MSANHKPATHQTPAVDPEALPFVAPCRRLEWSAPLRWLRAGWHDFRTAPGPGLTYGGILVLISWISAALAWKVGGWVLLLALLTGFVFLAPILALGLYSISCQIEAGLKPRLGYCLREGWRNLRNEMLFGLVLLIVFLLWARAGSAVHIFFPVEQQADWHALLAFLAIGSAVGAIFAFLVFAASAFSLPMMLHLRVDAITAVLTSVNAVLRNKGPMLLWAGIILLLLALGVLTGFVGLAIVMPVLGHATWHAYRDTILVDGWPRNRMAHEEAGE